MRSRIGSILPAALGALWLVVLAVVTFAYPGFWNEHLPPGPSENQASKAPEKNTQLDPASELNPQDERPPTRLRTSESDSETVVATGPLSSPAGLEPADTRLRLQWLGDEGTDPWNRAIVVQTDGSFAIDSSGLPPLPETQGRWNGRLIADAPRHRATSTGLYFRRSGEEIRIEPSRFALRLEPVDLGLIILLLMPALAVLWIALLQLRPDTGGASAGLYAKVCGGSWLLVSLAYTVRFALWEQHWIPLFLPDAQASSGLLVFAFFGSLIYLTFSIYYREPEYFTQASELDRDRLLRTIGGRLLAAPYVALVAWLLLSRVFPTLHSGAEVLFFGFFTGLWIKVVLDFLDRVGQSLLSQEALDRLKHRHQRTEAPEVPPAPVRRLAYLPPPTYGYFEAVEEARKTLHDLEGVIGVGPGHRVSSSDGQTDEPALVVFVAEKKALAPDAPDLIPPSIGGYRTDVVQPGPVEPGECDPVAPNLFWDKLTSAAAPADQPLDRFELAWVGDVLVLANQYAKADYCVRLAVDHQRFSPLQAYHDISETLDDLYDFVAFLPSPQLNQSSYYIPVYNEIKGIDFYKERSGEPGSFSERPAGVSKLRGFQVHGGSLTLRNLLHELGHAWLAYVPNGSDRYELLDGWKMHWSQTFDGSCTYLDSQGTPQRGTTCMTRSRGLWTKGPGPGTYKFERPPENPAEKSSPDASRFGFCSLDLYLMGLIPASEVETVHRIEPLGNPQDLESGTTYQASLTEYSITDIVDTVGPRQPTFSPRQEFQQLFVVVDSDLERGKERARTVDRLRLDHARNVERKTLGRVTLKTDRKS